MKNNKSLFITWLALVVVTIILFYASANIGSHMPWISSLILLIVVTLTDIGIMVKNHYDQKREFNQRMEKAYDRMLTSYKVALDTNVWLLLYDVPGYHPGGHKYFEYWDVFDQWMRDNHPELVAIQIVDQTEPIMAHPSITLYFKEDGMGAMLKPISGTLYLHPLLSEEEDWEEVRTAIAKHLNLDIDSPDFIAQFPLLKS